MGVVTIRRGYDDGCGAAHALNLIGERWALLVVRELLLGPKRFTDLRAGLPGISPNVLTQRLHELEEASVIRRHRLAPPAGASVYQLTEWGQELEPVILELHRWGARSPQRHSDARFSVDATILSLRTTFDPVAAAGRTAEYGLVLGEYSFRVRVHDGAIDFTRGEPEQPLAILDTDPCILIGLVFAGADLDHQLSTGGLKVKGDLAAARDFVGLFKLPEQAAGCWAQKTTTAGQDSLVTAS